LRGSGKKNLEENIIIIEGLEAANPLKSHNTAKSFLWKSLAGKSKGDLEKLGETAGRARL